MKKLFVIVVAIIAMLSLTACSNEPKELMDDIFNIETVKTYSEEEEALIMYLIFEDKTLVSFDGLDDRGYWQYTYKDAEGHDGYGWAWPSYVISVAESYGWKPE